MKLATVLGALVLAFCTAAFGIGAAIALRTDTPPTRELRGTLAAVTAEKHVPVVGEHRMAATNRKRVNGRWVTDTSGKNETVRKPAADPAAHAYWLSLRVSGDTTRYATSEEWGGCPACDRFINEVAPGAEVELIVSDLPHNLQSSARIIHGYSAGGKTYRGFIRADVIRPYALAVLGGLTLLFGFLFAGRVRNLVRQARG